MDAPNLPAAGNIMLDVVLCVAFIYQFVLMYIKFGLHLRMSEVALPVITRALFSLLLGGLAFFGDFFKLVLAERTGMTSLTPLFSSLPGVVITITIWVYFVKSLKFRPLLALEISVYTYLFFQTASGATRLVSAVFFAQDPTAVDYQKYLAVYAINFLVSIGIYSAMHYVLEHKPNLLIVRGMNNHISGRSGAFAVFQLVFIYICAALVMILIPKTIAGSTVSLIMLALFSAFSITLNSNRYAQAEIQDKEKQVESMLKSLDQFSSIKHDFYNILQTYNGYFEIGDLEACRRYHQSLVDMTTAAGDLLDLSRRAAEHPALVALLLNKHERAEGLNIHLSISLNCSLSGLAINDFDICRIVSCLLDNAIEAAAESKERRASFAIEQDAGRSKRITIINNSVAPIDVRNAYMSGFTSKNGHKGIGLANAKKIIERYPPCTLQLYSVSNEVVAVLELGK